jgi:hypothetical protein
MVTQDEAIAVHQSPGARSMPVTGATAHEAHLQAVDSNDTPFQRFFLATITVPELHFT